ncbi:MAG: uracil-DNA glycosylase [Gallionella sp.]|nr:uracil-DNA glycosylase [Gallionella sp.]
MDRNEAVLRELNLYPQWVRRNRPAPQLAQEAQETQVSGYAALTRPTKTAEELPAVRTEPVEGHVFTADVVRHAHHERHDELAAANNISVGLPVPALASRLDNLGWPELKQQVRDCTACKLRSGCTQTVFGAGDEHADWLFVGEGPGEEEDVRGEPFVGQAGKLLDNMLLAIKLKRGKSVYIANVVKCRPPGNRNPDAEEIAQCLPYLHRQIELIKPKVIVALGKTASAALLGDDAPLGTLRGRLHDFNGIPLVATYHPAYLLRTPSEKAKAWQDLCLAAEAMQKLL